MSTINQLGRASRSPKTYKSASPALANCPQRRGVCTRVYTTTPAETPAAEPAAAAESVAGSEE